MDTRVRDPDEGECMQEVGRETREMHEGDH